ncbi:hypothetical protein I0C86_42285, partial [Plantactinospora sp. S1510]|nr:hypothetical protein [Plantactinospora alkalitolerans]
MTARRTGARRRALGIGAVLAGAALRGVLAGPWTTQLQRTNFRGRTVTLAAGPALAAAAAR